MNKDTMEEMLVKVHSDVGVLVNNSKAQTQAFAEMRKEVREWHEDHEQRITRLEVMVKVVIGVGSVVAGGVVFISRILPLISAWMGWSH